MKVSSDAGAFHLVNGRSVRESAPLNRRDKWRDNNLMRPDFESQRLPLIRIAHRRMATGEDDHTKTKKRSMKRFSLQCALPAMTHGGKRKLVPKSLATLA
jgi:hypothetical protein